MRVLGIDPGLKNTGYGIVDDVEGDPRFIDSGRVKTEANKNLSERIREIFLNLERVIAHYKPNVMGIEEVFLSRNVSMALKLGHARGAILLAASNAGLDIHEYSALEIKMALVGYGRASKDQVRYMVENLLRPKGPVSADAIDALAVAICHIHTLQLKSEK